MMLNRILTGGGLQSENSFEVLNKYFNWSRILKKKKKIFENCVSKQTMVSQIKTMYQLQKTIPAKTVKGNHVLKAKKKKKKKIDPIEKAQPHISRSCAKPNSDWPMNLMLVIGC